MSNITSAVTVQQNSGQHAGGVIGYASGGNLSYLTSSGDVTSVGNNVGGVAGYLANAFTLATSSATGNISGSTYVGGLVGVAISSSATSTISGSYATGNTTASNNASGFAGRISGNSTVGIAVSDSYSTGNATSTSGSTGGFVSFNQGYVVFSRVYTTSDVYASGGSCGGFGSYVENSGGYDMNVIDAFARGSVNCANYKGGFFGYVNNLNIENSYATGEISGSNIGGRYGGFAGTAANVTGSNNYWDTTTSGLSSTEDTVSTGTSTANMLLQATYSGWDFTNVWGIDSAINDGYPYLRALQSGDDSGGSSGGSSGGGRSSVLTTPPAPSIYVRDVKDDSAVVHGTYRKGLVVVNLVGLVFQAEDGDEMEVDFSGVPSGFSYRLSDLMCGSDYEVKAFARNSVDTTYSEVISFSTEPCPDKVVEEEIANTEEDTDDDAEMEDADTEAEEDEETVKDRLARLQRMVAELRAQMHNLNTNNAVAATAQESGATRFDPDVITRDLYVGDSGDDVSELQLFLIEQDSGPSAKELARVGATGYFGSYTKNALGEFQLQNGIMPYAGYFGHITRNYLSENH